jgi:3-hydroxybutyryl-CoA dehydratase
MLDDNCLNLRGLSIDEVYIGLKRSMTKTISEHDVYAFAGITGDFNPIHVNEEYAKTTRFGGRIAHGMLSASFVSTVFGMLLPGADAIYLSQTLQFLRPVRFGDTLTATGEVVKIIPEKKLLYAKVTVTNQKGEVVVEGEGSLVATKPSKK